MSIATISLERLKQAVQIKEQIASLEAELAAVIGGTVSTPAVTALVPKRRGRPPGKAKLLADSAAALTVPTAVAKQGRGGRRHMSPEARARIAAAQKARWAKVHAAQGNSPKTASASTGRRKRRTISPEGRASMAAAAKARWARFRKQPR